MESEAKKYEIAYLVSPDVPEEDVVRVAGVVTKLIADVEGTVRNITEPRKRRLAYPIKKARAAYFGVTTFSAGKEAPAEIMKKLKFEKEILRALVVEEEIQPVRTSFRTHWQPTESGITRREPSRKEETSLTAEEREAAIETIDKKLEEILG